MDALNTAVNVPENLDSWNHPDFDLHFIRHVEFVTEEKALVILKGGGLSNPIRIYDIAEGSFTIVPSAEFQSISKAWSLPNIGVIAKAANCLWKISLDDITKIVSLPDDVKEFDVGVQLDSNGSETIFIAAIEDRNKKPDPLDPKIFPPVLKYLTLTGYSSSDGKWFVINDKCDMLAERISISQNGNRCMFGVMDNYIPEEGERGDWYSSVVSPDQEIVRISKNAGRIGEACVSPNGDYVVYQANFSADKPVTTHMNLYICPTNDINLAPSIFFGKETQIDKFNFFQNIKDHEDNLLWVNYIDGLDSKTNILNTSGTILERLEIPSTEPISRSHNSYAYATENGNDYPGLVINGKVHLLPQPHAEFFDSITATKILYSAFDKTKVEAILYEKAGTPENAPLLVFVHGGPAIGMRCLRSAGAASTRYPHRHLLNAGYRVLSPCYRGTLGFGDEFSQKNINNQGITDIGDVISGIDYLRSYDSGRLKFEDQVGIFGGSYGGYLTIMGLSTQSIFKAGVAMYGFVSARWMSLEGGDFTWEDEYVGPQEWPLTEEAQKHDSFNSLCKVTKPMLLLHGEDDDICPVSQSFVAFRQLQRNNVPTGIVTYPTEGHGFELDSNREDRDRRTLAWFLTHIPIR